MRVLAIVLAMAMPAMAQVPVLPECVELAAREGFPTDVLDAAQVKRAKIRMAWLRVRHPSDPIVRECRAAIAAAKLRQSSSSIPTHESQ